MSFYALLRWDDICRLKVSDFKQIHTMDDSSYQFSIDGGKTLMFDKSLKRLELLYPIICPLRFATLCFWLTGVCTKQRIAAFVLFVSLGNISISWARIGRAVCYLCVRPGIEKSRILIKS